MAFGRYLTSLDWSPIDFLGSVEELYAYLSTLIHTGLDTILSTKRVKIHYNDAPWITKKLKSLISQRQKAFHHGNRVVFKFYRNVVNKERKRCKSLYYMTKVHDLSDKDPKKWWFECRGIVKTPTDLCTKLLAGRPCTASNMATLANDINQAFLLPQQDYPPLCDGYRVSTGGFVAPTVSIEGCLKGLSAVSKCKAGGPDDIPNWVLREYALELVHPVLSIINCSIAKWVYSRNMEVRECWGPQGRKLGPWLFLVMINGSNSAFVEGPFQVREDTTVYEIVGRNKNSHAQSLIDEITSWSTNNKFQLHPKKCNELRMTLSRSPANHELVQINGCRVGSRPS